MMASDALAVETKDARAMETKDAPAMEAKIAKFIYDRIGEKVRLSLGTEDEVTIESICQHGSTILGIFWLNVLQHPNNYPMQHYPYRKLYKAGGKYLVSLRVDTVKVDVCLVTGRLTVSGAVSLDWFVLRFDGVMEAYTQPVTAGKKLKNPFDAEQLRLFKTVKKHMLHRYILDWPDVVVDKDMNVLDARQIIKQLEEEARKQDEEEAVPLEPLQGEKPMAVYHIDNLLSSSDLELHLKKLSQGMMTDGATLFAVWTSLLNRWFSDPNTKVFIVTPAVDVPSLERLCHIVLNQRLTAALEMLATPLQSRCGRLADVRREVMLKLPSQDQVFAEYKVYNSMIFPQVEFQAKFIAGLCGDSVEVLLTSADSETKHFQAEHSSMVMFQVLSAAEFDSRLLAPIVASID